MRARLFLRIAGTEARTAMSYRVDFWLNVVVEACVQFTIAWFLWTAMFAGGAGRIGGYDRDGMMLYYLAVIVISKVTRNREFEKSISQDIYEGGLNRYLLYPLPYFGFKLAQQVGSIAPALLQVVPLGLLVALFLDVPPDVHVGAAQCAMALVALLVAKVLAFLVSVPIQSVAFWADNVWSLEVGRRFLFNILGGFMLPLSLFPLWAQEGLFWAPFRFLYGFPAEVLLGRVSAGAWAAGLAVAAGWCLVFAAAGRAVWRRGVLQYSGVGI